MGGSASFDINTEAIEFVSRPRATSFTPRRRKLLYQKEKMDNIIIKRISMKATDQDIRIDKTLYLSSLDPWLFSHIVSHRAVLASFIFFPCNFLKSFRFSGVTTFFAAGSSLGETESEKSSKN